MFLRAKKQLKDGKLHHCWSIVENRRTACGRVVQRPVLYLGEINDSQMESWCRTIEILEHGQARPTQVPNNAFFRGSAPAPRSEAAQPETPPAVVYGAPPELGDPAPAVAFPEKKKDEFWL